MGRPRIPTKYAERITFDPIISLFSRRVCRPREPRFGAHPPSRERSPPRADPSRPRLIFRSFSYPFFLSVLSRFVLFLTLLFHFLDRYWTSARRPPFVISFSPILRTYRSDLPPPTLSTLSLFPSLGRSRPLSPSLDLSPSHSVTLSVGAVYLTVSLSPVRRKLLLPPLPSAALRYSFIWFSPRPLKALLTAPILS